VIFSLHRRHRTIEFKKFQAKISSRVVAPALRRVGCRYAGEQGLAACGLGAALEVDHRHSYESGGGAGGSGDEHVLAKQSEPERVAVFVIADIERGQVDLARVGGDVRGGDDVPNGISRPTTTAKTAGRTLEIATRWGACHPVDLPGATTRTTVGGAVVVGCSASRAAHGRPRGRAAGCRRDGNGSGGFLRGEFGK